MKSHSKSVVLAMGGAILLLAALLQIALRFTTPKEAKPHQPIAALLPSVISGVHIQDEPIASTEEMKKAVGELLNYSDAAYRIYNMTAARVSVYVAWWEAGRMSPRLVAGHTPDICWLENGWRRANMAGKEISDFRDVLATTGFPAGEARVFELKGQVEHVVFWHKVGDEILAYDTPHGPPWWAVFDEISRNGLDLRKEQLFVRISSNVPLSTIWRRPELAVLHQSLRHMGLNVERSTSGAGK